MKSNDEKKDQFGKLARSCVRFNGQKYLHLSLDCSVDDEKQESVVVACSCDSI